MATASRWLRLGTFWGDAGLWLYEVYRASAGEVVYADFMWMYPPLSLGLFAGAFRVFGATFLTAQVMLSVLSTIAVLLAWQAARRLVSPALALIVALLLVAIGATSGSDIALFSLRVYTPALVVGLIGGLLMFIGALDYVGPSRPPTRALVYMGIGAAIALLGKHEFGAGAVATYAGVVLVDRVTRFHGAPAWAWMRRAIALAVLAFAPSVAAYALIGSWVGADNLALGMDGYGTARLACPLWPTGLGLFGGVAALCQGLVILAAASAAECTLARRRPARAEVIVWILGVLGAAVVVAYLPFAGDNYPPNALGMLGGAGSYLLSIRGFFIPAMWLALVSVAVTGIMLLRAIVQGRAVDTAWARHFLVITLAAALCVRSMFGGTLANVTTTPVGAVPLLLLFIVSLIDRAYSPTRGTRTPRLAVGTPHRMRVALLGVLLGYGVLKTAAGIAVASRQDYQRLMTRAGPVILNDGGLSAGVYRYIEDNSRPEDRILDIPYSGGTMFASRRASPIFSTLLLAQRLSDENLQRDRDQLATRGAALIIVPDLPNYGSYYGVSTKVGCTFPRFAWEYVPDPDAVPRRQPVIQFVESNYVEQARIGHLRILRPR